MKNRPFAPRLCPLLMAAAASALTPVVHSQEQPAERRRPLAAEPLPEIQREPLPAPRPAEPRTVRPQTEVSRPAAPTFDGAPTSISGLDDRHAIVHYDVEGNGTHWARGRDYKASASAEGFAFIPFLGSDAPKNYPVRFRLAHVERDGHALELAPLAAVTRNEHRFVLDRGPVEVRYDLTPAHVEQSFALDVPPGTGDLILRLEVTTELAAAPHAGGFRFETDRGGVDYGAAIVFDGAGRQAAVEETWTDAGIELTVPAAFLATAGSSIVIDPILSTFAIDIFTRDLLRADAAYDLEDNRYCVVYEERFSASDWDIFSAFVDGSTGARSNSLYVELGAELWSSPKIAILRGTRRYLIVAQAPSVVQTGSTDIVARYRSAEGTGVLDPAFILKGATPSYGCRLPDVGGESINSAFSYFCVAYVRDWGADDDVFAIIVDDDGNFVGPEIGLGTFVSRDESAPAVSKSTGDGSGTTRHNIAWEVIDLNTGESRVDACQLSFDGSTVFGPFPVTPFSSTATYFDVEVSELSNLRFPGNNDQYWVVTYDDGPSSISDAFVGLCAGEQLLSRRELQNLEHADRTNNDDNVVIATTARSFQLGYRSGDELIVTILQPIFNLMGITERRLPVANDSPSGIAAASTFSGGSVAQDALFVWSANRAVSGGSFDIYGARIESQLGLFASGYQYCYGAANSTGDRTFIQAFGDRDRSNPQTIVVSGMPANTFGLLLASLSSGSVPNPAGLGNLCLTGSIGRYPIFNSGPLGRHTYSMNPQQIPQPASVVMAGIETWFFQAWHRDVSPTGPTSNFSNGVGIPFR